MQIACTKKLFDELKIAPEAADMALPPLFCWSANIVTINRRKAVVCVNASSRFGFVLYGIKAKELKELPELLNDEIKRCLLMYCIRLEIVERYFSDAPGVQIVKSSDRSSTAKLNKTVETVECLEEFLDKNGLSQPLLAKKLNIIPFGDSKGGYFHPIEKMVADFKEHYGDDLFSCNAVDLTIKLDLERYTAWRRLIVPMSYTFEQLHQAIQASFSWDEHHMYDFELQDGSNGYIRLELEQDEDEFEPPDDSCRVYLTQEKTLADFLPEQTDFVYTYDFGDSWEHEIHLNSIISDYNNYFPVCIMGEGDAPPEDVGGVDGYLRFLDAMANPSHPEHEDMKQWALSQYYRDFNIQYINHRLKYV